MTQREWHDNLDRTGFNPSASPKIGKLHENERMGWALGIASSRGAHQRILLPPTSAAGPLIIEQGAVFAWFKCGLGRSLACTAPFGV